jgi:hypothetical protein
MTTWSLSLAPVPVPLHRLVEAPRAGGALASHRSLILPLYAILTSAPAGGPKVWSAAGAQVMGVQNPKITKGVPA